MSDIDSRTEATNVIARALLDYAHPAHVPFHERYAAAEAALARVDEHLDGRTHAALAQACGDEARPSHLTVRLDNRDGVFTPADSLAPYPNEPGQPRPGWLARAIDWALGDRDA